MREEGRFNGRTKNLTIETTRVEGKPHPLTASNDGVRCETLERKVVKIHNTEEPRNSTFLKGKALDAEKEFNQSPTERT